MNQCINSGVAARPTPSSVSAPRHDFILRTTALTKHYGGVAAIEDLDITIYRNEVRGVIGPNGAGKSTLVGLLGGALTPTSGTIEFNGSDVTRLPAAERARRGIGRTYQIPRPFPDMTVRENLLAAKFSAAPAISARDANDNVQEILERTDLADAAALPARALPLLRRKRLEMARVLALRPKLLLLDEVGAGLIDAELSELIELIQLLSREIESILIVEHIMRVVRACCQSLMVLDFGHLLLEGPTAEVMASDNVGAVYLGTRRVAATEPRKAPEAATVQTDRRRHASFADMGYETRQSASEHAAPLLRLEGIHAGYGLARVLNGIDLVVTSGQATAILGTNGAGKSTLAAVLSGTIRPSAGCIFIAGTEVTGWDPHRIAALGVAQCLEGRRIFAGLSVEENLLIAARGVSWAEQRRRLDRIFGLFPILHERKAGAGISLSGGEQQMLAIGRALMAEPRLIVFDEISLGLAPITVDRLYAALAELRSAGLAMLIVEQDVDRALDLVDYVHVLERGLFALSGPPHVVKVDPRLRHLYIGEAD